jgi:hypothetical protein
VTVPLVPDLNPNPWTPPTGSGGGQTQADVSDPWLSMNWTDVADYVPTPPLSGNGSKPETVPTHTVVMVDLGSVRAVETELYNALGNLVDEYTILEAEAITAVDSPTFFGQQATYSVQQTVYGDSPLQTPVTSTVTFADAIQSSAVAFAASIEPSVTIALAAAANAIEALGQFAALLQAAGFAYASADSASALPQPVNPPLVLTDIVNPASPVPPSS